VSVEIGGTNIIFEMRLERSDNGREMDISWPFDNDHWLQTSYWITGSFVALQVIIGLLFTAYMRRLATRFQELAEERKAELEGFSLENQKEFARLHIERSTLVREFYGSLWEVTTALTALNSYSTDKENVDQRLIVFEKAHEELCGHYKHKRLAFPKETGKRIEELIGTLNNTALLCASIIDGFQQSEKFERRLSEISIGMAAIGTLCDSLEDEFREMSGANEHEE